RLGRLLIGMWRGMYHGDSGIGPMSRSEPRIVSAVPRRVIIGAIGGSRDPNGHEVIFAAGPHGIWKSEAGKWTPVKGSWHRAIRSILPEGQDQVWVGTESGLYRLDLATGSSTRLSRPADILSSNVSTVKRLSNGTICVGSSGGVDFF